MIHGLPERLTQMRWNTNLSQHEVARRIGVSPSTISSYETGEKTPGSKNLLALSYLYKCSTDYLLGKERKTPTVTLDADGLTPKQIELLSELIETMRK